MVKKVSSLGELQNEIKSGYSLVDFYTTWCGPCKMLSPIVEELSTEFDGDVKFIKVDIDQASDIQSHFNVRSIPTLYFFKNSKLINYFSGFMPKDNLKQFIAQAKNKQ